MDKDGVGLILCSWLEKLIGLDGECSEDRRKETIQKSEA